MAYTTINKSKEHFDTLLYTATGTQSVTGAEFQPDLSWVKSRSTTSSHYLLDAVRGSTKTVKSDSTDAEGTQNLITSFNSDGVTLGSANWSDGRTAVIWNWKANGAGSSNTDGSVSSTVSVNTTAGFSIVSYTANGNAGTTIGHGLNAVPSMIITKDRDASGLWLVYHAKSDSSAPQNKYLELNSTGTVQDYPVWNDTAPTSSVFTIGTASENNTNGRNIIAYCFAEKQGYSKFGSYTGNGNADGTFVYTGFKPAFIIHKRTDATGNWNMHDSTRSLINTADERLYSNLSNAEDSGGDYGDDILSNGFKIRTTEASWNASGGSFIYMAFAEAPLVGTNNVPCTAR